MNFNTKIPKQLKPYLKKELDCYKSELETGNLENSWKHLERAHIIGQRYPIEHTFVHWEMLKFGFKIKNRKEVFGQLPRLLIGGVKSFVGKIPIGNPGGANVSPIQSFPIEEEILDIFQKTGIK